MARDGGDPQRDVLASGNPLIFGFYTNYKQVVLPEPDAPPDVARGGIRTIEDLIAQAQKAAIANRRVYLPSYFNEEYIFFNILAKELERAIQTAQEEGSDHASRVLAGYEVRRIYRRDMVTLWVVAPRRPTGPEEKP